MYVRAAHLALFLSACVAPPSDYRDLSLCQEKDAAALAASKQLITSRFQLSKMKKIRKILKLVGAALP